MARPRKIGLDYFPVKVNLSPAVKFAMDDHGEVQVAGIYFFLMTEIYGEHGYYMRWNERMMRSFTKKIYSDPALVGAVVESLINNGAFDADLYARHGILTSVEIQANYVRACDKREEVVIISDYSLLDDRDTTRANIIWENFPASDCPRNPSGISPEYARNDTDIPPESPRFSYGFPPDTRVSGPGIPPETSEKSFPDTETPVSGSGNPQTKRNNTNTITNNNRTVVSHIDNLLTRMTTIIGIETTHHWVADRGTDYCAAQMTLMDRQSDIKRPRQWLLSALEKNYANWQPPTQLQSKPKPDRCPQCGGRGVVTDFTNNKTRPCTCVSHSDSARHEPPVSAPLTAAPNTDRDPVALAARTAAQMQA